MAVQLGGPEIDLKEAIDLSGLTAFNATDNQVLISPKIIFHPFLKARQFDNILGKQSSFLELSTLTIVGAIDIQAGAQCDAMYLKQGEHLMKKGVYTPALNYLNQSLNINPESKVCTLLKYSMIFFEFR